MSISVPMWMLNSMPHSTWRLRLRQFPRCSSLAPAPPPSSRLSLAHLQIRHKFSISILLGFILLFFTRFYAFLHDFLSFHFDPGYPSQWPLYYSTSPASFVYVCHADFYPSRISPYIPAFLRYNLYLQLCLILSNSSSVPWCL